MQDTVMEVAVKCLFTYIHTFIDHVPKGAFQSQLQRKEKEEIQKHIQIIELQYYCRYVIFVHSLFAQKLGPNPSEMEVRTFVSIMKVIWNQARFLRLKLSRSKLC